MTTRRRERGPDRRLSPAHRIAGAGALALSLFAASWSLPGCTTSPPRATEGRSATWGYLRLVPRPGLPEDPGGAASYGDRRLRDARRVDYSRPGFAVVYADDAAAPNEDALLTLRAAAVGPHFSPDRAALAAGSAIRVENQSGSPRVLSCPAAGLVMQLGDGESARIPASAAGVYELFLLDAPGAQATVFAAPGTYAVVSQSGRFALSDLAPGRHLLRTWHPRFPSTSAWVELAANEVVRLDLEVGVGRPEASDGP